MEPMLAERTRTLPAREALPGGSWYEPKWDGFRALADVDGRTRLTSRRGADLTAHFPDVTDALAAQLPGTVLDGELVVWRDERLDFVALQERMTTSPKRVAALAARAPAHYVIFDLLVADGEDLRSLGYRERRLRLEARATELSPPLMLTPATDDPALAARWFEDYAPFGVEGLVVKGASQRYEPGKRGWLKLRYTATTEAIVGAVDGPLAAPSRLVLGAWDAQGELSVVGGTAVLSPADAARVGAHLEPPRGAHPWPAEVPGHLLGGLAGQKQPASLTLVEPAAVVEVVVDVAFDRGRWRHPIRFVRVRPELDPREVTLAALEVAHVPQR